jgi:hypothetical protein
MSDLCGIPAAQMQAEVIAWKTAKGEPWAQALAFAQAGRAGYPYPTTATIPTPPAKYKDCKNCGFVVWGGIFSDLASRWPHASWWF